MTISSSSRCGVIKILIYTNKDYNGSKIVIYFEYFKVFIYVFSRSARSNTAKAFSE